VSEIGIRETQSPTDGLRCYGSPILAEKGEEYWGSSDSSALIVLIEQLKRSKIINMAFSIEQFGGIVVASSSSSSVRLQRSPHGALIAIKTAERPSTLRKLPRILFLSFDDDAITAESLSWCFDL
jgi:hypothetical protein